MLHEDLGDDGADGSVACRRVECNFEQGNLCNFESSHDEATRIRRQADDEEVDELAVNDGNVPLLLRSWSIWMGRRASTQQSIDAGLIFSNTNQQFAAVFLEPQQTGLLSITLNNPKRATVVRFRIFEATRGMRLKVCCDQSCPVQTEWGLYRGHRHWLKKTIVCPKTTKQLTFECSNQGQHRGACGVDDVFLVSSSCRRLFKGNDDA